MVGGSSADGSCGGNNSSELSTASILQLKGHLLVDAVFQKWGAGTMTIPWLHPSTGSRNIVRDQVNRPIMESLAEAYCDRTLDSGLNVDCSGKCSISFFRQFDYWIILSFNIIWDVYIRHT